MSHLAVVKHGHRVTVPPAGALKSGVNLNDQVWWGGNKIWNDMWAPASVNSYVDSGGTVHSVPVANMDSDQWVKSMPAGAVAITRAVGTTPDGNSATITWEGNIDTLTATAGQGTITAFNNTTKTAQLSFDRGAGFPVGIRYTFSDTVNYPKNIKCIANNTSGTFDANIIARIKDAVSGGSLRMMQLTGVNDNGGPAPDGRWDAPFGGGTPASPIYKIDVANLATINSGMWVAAYGLNQDGDGQPDGSWVNHGTPVQALCDLANAVGADLWFTININCSPAAVTRIAENVRDYLDPSLKAYFEVGNENWNFSFYGTSQLLMEAIYTGLPPLTGGPTAKIFTGTSSGSTLTVTSWVSGSPLQVGDNVGNAWNNSHQTIASFGTGTGGTGTYTLSGPFGNGDVTTDSRMSVGSGGAAERSIQKTIEFMGYVSTAFANPRTGGGSKPTLKRVFAWQQSNGTLASQMLAYAPDGVNPLHSNIDVFANAPYIGPNEIDPNILTDYSTYVDIIEALYPDTDWRWSDVADVKTACAAYGIEYASYEGGPSTYFPNTTAGQTLANTVHRSPEMYDWMMYYYQRGEDAVPGADFNFYAMCSPIGTNFGVWELIETPYQTVSKATTPKLQAVMDYNAGQRMLHTLNGQLIAKVGATAGTKVGVLRRRFTGSTVTITSTPSGAFSFVDPTAQNLVVQVADATKFASATSISWDVAETGGSPSTTKHTTGTCPVTAATFFSPNTASDAMSVMGSSGLTVRHIGPQGSGTYFIAKGSNARTDGYFEVDVVSNTNNLNVGLADSTYAPPDYVGGSAHSIGWSSSGALLANGSVRANWSSYSGGDHLDFFLSVTGKLYGRKNNGTWLGADGAGSVDPNTDTGGVDVSAYVTGSGGLYPTPSFTSIGTAITARFADADFIHAKPTGAHDWNS